MSFCLLFRRQTDIQKTSRYLRNVEKPLGFRPTSTIRCSSGWCADEMVRIRRRVWRGDIELGFRRKVRGSPNHLVEMQPVLLKFWAMTVTDDHRLSTCQQPATLLWLNRLLPIPSYGQSFCEPVGRDWVLLVFWCGDVGDYSPTNMTAILNSFLFRTCLMGHEGETQFSRYRFFDTVCMPPTRFISKLLFNIFVSRILSWQPYANVW